MVKSHQLGLNCCKPDASLWVLDLPKHALNEEGRPVTNPCREFATGPNSAVRVASAVLYGVAMASQLRRMGKSPPLPPSLEHPNVTAVGLSPNVQVLFKRISNVV